MEPDRIEIAFQQNHCGQPVYRPGALFNADAAFPEHAVGLHTGQALIPELHRDARALAEPLGEVARVLPLAALIAAHVARVAEKKQRNVPFLRQSREPVQIRPNIGALKCFQPLRRDSKLITHREPDPFFSEVQRQDAPSDLHEPSIAVPDAYIPRVTLRHDRLNGKPGQGSRVVVQVFSPAATNHKFQNTSTSILAVAAIIALLYFGRTLCITLVISVIIAFILEPFVQFFVRFRMPRGAASFVVCSLALLMVYFLGLGIYTELSGLSEDLPSYSERANALVDSVAERIDRMEQNLYKLLVPKRLQERDRNVAEQQAKQQAEKKQRGRRAAPVEQQPVSPPGVQEVRIQQDRMSITRYLYTYVSSYYNVLLMISFVPFLVYFMLSWRDHIRKTALSVFEGPGRVVANNMWRNVAEVARAYVFGNFLLGILLSLASALCFWSWHLPYWLLLGPISGFLSLVPYVGLPLAVVPPLVAALAVYANATPYFVIAATIGFFHLIALNLLYPQLVGARVHLNPLAVTVALMFWGTIWGGIGLLLAIPITAGMKAVFDSIEHLQPLGHILGD